MCPQYSFIHRIDLFLDSQRKYLPAVFHSMRSEFEMGWQKQKPRIHPHLTYTAGQVLETVSSTCLCPCAWVE